MTSINYSHEPAQNQHKVVSAQLEHFWCQDEPQAIQTHKTHHALELGETTTFPFIVYFLPLHEAHIQMAFCPRSPEIPTIRILATLGAHNFACRPLIEMRFKAKL